jgi:signal transduction histidine kinase
VKHAGADSIRLRLRGAEDQVTLEVADDGAGFDLEGPPGAGPAPGPGLRAMSERVAELGGELQITSTPGAGAVVRASFPRRPA